MINPDQDASSRNAGSARASLLSVWRGKTLPRDVRALGTASFFQDVASEMVYPLLPGFLVALGGGPALLGVMESAAEAVLAFVKRAAGEWSDRVGKRKAFVVAGYGFSALLRPVLALAAVPAHVITLRGADRLAKGLRTAPRDAMISEAIGSERKAEAFGFHRGLDHLGAALGPLIATAILWVRPESVRVVFALATIPALIGVFVVWSRVRERPAMTGSETKGNRESPPAELRVLLGAIFLFALGNASDAFLLLRAAELGLTAMQLTLLWSLFHVIKFAGAAPVGRLADRISPRRTLMIGWLSYAAIWLGFGFVESRGWLIVLVSLYAIHFALTEGSERALVAARAGSRAGTALGRYHMWSGLGTFASSLWFGVIWSVAGESVAFSIGAALALLAALLLGAVGRSDRVDAIHSAE